jgi:ribonuclease-3
MPNSDLQKLEQILKYTFKNQENILTAIQHPGLKKRNKEFAHKFEKLEFLGDRVLGLSLATLLYEHFRKDTEGDLAVRIATLAGTDFFN